METRKLKEVIRRTKRRTLSLEISLFHKSVTYLLSIVCHSMLPRTESWVEESKKKVVKRHLARKMLLFMLTPSY